MLPYKLVSGIGQSSIGYVQDQQLISQKGNSVIYLLIVKTSK